MAKPEHALPGQVVLVLQGGGALGAYQAGVYEAMAEAGIAPDWVIGTSIGAIHGALIAGNAPAQRVERLRAFWQRMENPSPAGSWAAVLHGVPNFFRPRPAAWVGPLVPMGLEQASYYTIDALRETLAELVDARVLEGARPRLTVGAVRVDTAELTYFDSRRGPLRLDHVLASSALPPAFPAVRIGEHAYWDGGVYSNTPIEAVFSDNPRRSSIIFAVDVWQAVGPEPESVWQVLGRQKDIQYASRDDAHIAQQQQLHRLRRVIRELAKELPAAKQRRCSDLAAWGCGTTMHIVRLLAPTLASEDWLKDIDFSPAGIRERWQAGRRDAMQMIARAPWQDPVDPMESVVVHELSARTGMAVRQTS
jgi:NTE family protein